MKTESLLFVLSTFFLGNNNTVCKKKFKPPLIKLSSKASKSFWDFDIS